jgi:hypothetical protein
MLIVIIMIETCTKYLETLQKNKEINQDTSNNIKLWIQAFCNNSESTISNLMYDKQKLQDKIQELIKKETRVKNDDRRG